jgi:hypothetical protein
MRSTITDIYRRQDEAVRELSDWYLNPIEDEYLDDIEDEYLDDEEDGDD